MRTFVLIALLTVLAQALAQPAPVLSNTPLTEEGEGGSSARRTFTNPVLWADVPDPDVIRVGEDFWMVSTTMHLMPGGPVMHSRDLVNWEYASYLFDRLTDSPKYDMQGGTVYGKGQWATSLKWHDGVFYALFAPNDSPGGDSYLYTTSDPWSGWTLRGRLPHFHDCSLLFDDDGRVYVFSGTGRVQELEADLSAVRSDGVDLDVQAQLRDSSETGLLEGTRVVKKDGIYYMLMVSWPTDGNRRQVCYRSSCLQGPWEKRIILEDSLGGFPYAGQGTIVDDAEGNWWGVVFQDRGAVGRVLTLEPCRWVDGWPILGDSEGRIPQRMAIPCDGVLQPLRIVGSDDFDGSELGDWWQWNHNPVEGSWSLTERPGWLRLRTCGGTADNLFVARGTLSQRMMGPTSSTDVLLDVSHLQEGDRAGLSAFNGDAVQLVITRCEGQLLLTVEESSARMEGPDQRVADVETTVTATMPLGEATQVYLRIEADFRLDRDIATLSYSLDGTRWRTLGRPFTMQYDYRRVFMGSRFALFCYATQAEGGYVDVDYFRYVP